MVDFIIKHGLVDLVKWMSVLITAFISVFYAISDFKKEGKRNLKPLGWVIIGFVGLSLLATYFDMKTSNRLQTEAEEKLDKNFKSTEKHIVSAGKDNTKELRDSIASLRQKNDRLRKELTDNLVLLSTYVKGASYKDFNLSIHRDFQNQPRLVLTNTSKYVGNNILVRLTDFDGLMKCEHQTTDRQIDFNYSCLDSVSSRDLRITLNPNSSSLLFPVADTSIKRHYILKMTDNSGNTVEYYIVLGWCNKGYVASYRIYNLSRKLLKSGENYHKLSNSYWYDTFKLDKKIGYDPFS